MKKFDDNNLEALEAMTFATNYHSWILKEFAPYIKGNIAEVGAGTGNFTREILKCPDVEKIYSFEPNPNIFNRLKQNITDQKVIGMNGFFDGLNTLNNTMGGGMFDTVIYVNVMEHVEDDFTETKKIFDSLSNGGYFLMFVPALRWLYSEHDRCAGHFRRYTKKTAKALALKSSFKIEKLHYFDGLGAIVWFLFYTLLGQTSNNTNVSLYDKIVVPFEKTFESIFHPVIGKNLVLVAKKEI